MNQFSYMINSRVIKPDRYSLPTTTFIVYAGYCVFLPGNDYAFGVRFNAHNPLSNVEAHRPWYLEYDMFLKVSLIQAISAPMKIRMV